LNQIEAPPRDTRHPVKAARQAAGWTQQELAERAGVAKLTVGHIERGWHKWEPHPATIEALARALGVTPGQLRPRG
jgi:transcriptional regulator with XRE-family HTH domain